MEKKGKRRYTGKKVNEMLKAYFKERAFECVITKGRNYYAIEVIYDGYLFMEDVEKDLCELFGEDYTVNAHSNLPYIEYIAYMAMEIESDRKKLIGKLKDKPLFKEFHVNRLVNLPLFDVEMALSQFLPEVRNLTAHPELVHIWEIGKGACCKGA